MTGRILHNNLVMSTLRKTPAEWLTCNFPWAVVLGQRLAAEDCPQFVYHVVRLLDLGILRKDQVHHWFGPDLDNPTGLGLGDGVDAEAEGAGRGIGLGDFADFLAYEGGADG